MKIKCTVELEVEVPEGATHYRGTFGEYTWYKRKDTGVVGEHWYFLRSDGVWHFSQHARPDLIKPVEELSIEAWEILEIQERLEQCLDQ